MPSELVDLELGKLELLSIVDKGASGNDKVRPKIVLMKRKEKEGGIMGLFDRIRASVNKSLDDALKDESTNRHADEMRKALSASGLADDQIDKVLKSDTAQAAFLEMLETMGLSDAHKAALKMAFMSAMAATPPPTPPPSAKPEPIQNAEPSLDTTASALDEDKEKNRAEMMQKQLASLPQEIRKEFDELRQRTDELEKERAESIAKRDLAEQIAIAKLYPHVSGDIEKRAALFLAVKKQLGEAAHKLITGAFEEANRLAKGSEGLGQIGTAQPALDDGNGSEFESVVKRIQKDDGLTYERAYKRAKELHPKLYAAERTAQK